MDLSQRQLLKIDSMKSIQSHPNRTWDWNWRKISLFRCRPEWARRWMYPVRSALKGNMVFLSFVPIKQNRILVKCLVNRAVHMCSSETLNIEMNVIRKTSPDNFIAIRMKFRFTTSPVVTARKKPLYLQLFFFGDNAADHLIRKLRNYLFHTFPATKQVRWSNTMPLISTKRRVRCLSKITGRTTRRLIIRIKEHASAWFAGGDRRTMTSVIVGHVAATRHAIANDAVKIIYRFPPPAAQ